MTDIVLPESVLFLDADGVFAGLHNMFALDIQELTDTDGVNPGAVKLLSYLARKSQSVFVISSTWRYHSMNGEEPLERFIANGFARQDFHPTSPYTGKPGTRIGEIREWLQCHPEVTRHLAIDDESLINDRHVLPHVQSLQTDGRIGFTAHDFDLACTLLGVQHFDLEEQSRPRGYGFRFTKQAASP